MKLLLHPLKDHPLKEIIESTRFPHARTLRTSFIQKIKDAFFVFAGTIWEGKSERNKSTSINGNESVLTETRNHNHAGIFDYATLFIPRLINYLFELAWLETNNSFFNFLGALLFIINGPLLLARYLIVGVLTLVSIPIIGIVEIVSYFMKDGGKELEEKLLRLTVQILEEGISEATMMSLEGLLSAYPKLTLEDVLIKVNTNQDEEIEIVIHRPAASKLRDPVPIGSFSLSVFQQDESNKYKREEFKAILKLGLKSTDFMRTSITDELEKSNPELLNSLISP